MEPLPTQAHCLLNRIFEIENLQERLAFIRQKRRELQDTLQEDDLSLSEDQLQMYTADEIALGILERAYFGAILDESELDSVISNELEDDIHNNHHGSCHHGRHEKGNTAVLRNSQSILKEA